MVRDYFSVTTTEEAIQVLAERGPRARLIAGGTDLLLELERGARTGIDTLVDISRAAGLDRIVLDESGSIHLGPLVTHNQCVASKLVVERAFPLARAAWEVGAPQIRNRGTVAGNLITASPANDTIPPLLALGARLTLRSMRGVRVVALEDFYRGVRQIDLQPDEMLVDITFPALKSSQRGTFVKLGLRQAQAISLVDIAVVLEFEDGKVIHSAAITLGAVAPIIVHARAAEEYLSGKILDVAVIERAARLAQETARPIDDVRSSGAYRSEMVRVAVQRALMSIHQGEERVGFPRRPVLLWGKDSNGKVTALAGSTVHQPGTPIVTRINGQDYTFTTGQQKTLLRLLREEAGLIGTKEGCAEGECGACTVFLDGKAVMSCLVPAPRAHSAQIVTVEGLSGSYPSAFPTPEERASGAYPLHHVQQAFIDEGAVQCGYCTPGFLMSAVKLLEEHPRPARADIQQALTGNLCRCTGYYQIIAAIERAASQPAEFDEAIHGGSR